jgi:hypothetical protein
MAELSRAVTAALGCWTSVVSNTARLAHAGTSEVATRRGRVQTASLSRVGMVA